MSDNPDSKQPVVIGADAVMNVEQLVAASPIGERAIREAIRTGALKGRNIGGPTGFVTTWGAFKEWVTSGTTPNEGR